MPSKRTFYRYLIQVEVLSEDERDFGELHQVANAIEDDCSGQWEVTKVEEVDGPTMAKLLMEQASDPDFFQLTDEGEDIDEDEGDQE